MGHWGVRSYEVDEANDAIDAAMDRVHGGAYDDLMSDRNPMPVEEVHRQLANPETLAAAIDAVEEEFGTDRDAWDDLARLAFCGVVVLHAERGVPVADDLRNQAAQWLEAEELDWDPQPKRDVRRRREVELLRRSHKESD
ncbi:hypothetical protein [Tautonia rosea]|uniref:hypothetical protein n=1 Tax=Tautonia rosea TaxID=2728037 RepID=UPI001474BB1D|nr:hypothetical protein [Tautonia rosea]